MRVVNDLCTVKIMNKYHIPVNDGEEQLDYGDLLVNLVGKRQDGTLGRLSPRSSIRINEETVEVTIAIGGPLHHGVNLHLIPQRLKLGLLPWF